MKYNLIKNLREQKKLSQIDLVKKLNNIDCQINQPTVSGWENGKIKPSEKEVVALCKILECKEDDMLSVSDNIDLSLKKFKNNAYEFGKKFKPNEIKKIYLTIPAINDEDKQIYAFMNDILELSTIKCVPLPQGISTILIEKDVSLLSIFLVDFWNGSIEKNSK